MNALSPTEFENSLKQLIFSEPRFSEHLEECSHKVRSPFEFWVKDNSDEYIKYLKTGTTVEDNKNEVHKVVIRNISDLRDKTLLTFVTRCFESKNERFNDMEILVEDNVYKVHRLIVAAFIPVLMDDISKIPEESKSNGIIIDLRGISNKNSVECLIQYMYTGKVNPTSENFVEVLELSVNCRMQNFARNWVEAFESSKPLKVLKLLFRSRLARRYKWTEYVVRLNKVLALQFENLILTEKFLRLTTTELLDILRENEIGTQNEVVVFLGALKWLNYDWNNRKKVAVQIIKEIRFHQMNRNEMEACLSPPIVPELMLIDEIKNMVTDALLNRKGNSEERRMYRKAGAPNLKLWTTERKLSEPRKFADVVEAMQMNSEKAHYLEAENIERKQWTAGDETISRDIWKRKIDLQDSSSDKDRLQDITIEPKPVEMRTKLDFKIELNEKTAERADKEVHLISAKQTSVPEKLQSEPSVSISTTSTPSITTPDHAVKKPFSSSVAGEAKQSFLTEPEVSLIAFGDYYNLVDIAFIFRCDGVSLKSWKKHSTLPIDPKLPFDPLIISDLKNIYLVGGVEHSLKNNELHLSTSSSFYKYDFKANKLIQLKEMNEKRVLHSGAFISNRLYVVGGRLKKDSVSNTVEMYDFQKNEWQRITTTMHTSRYGCSSIAIKQRLFIFGGITQIEKTQKFQLLSDVVVYNPLTNNWSKMRETLPIPVAYCSVVYHENMIYLIGGRVKIPSSSKLTMSEKVYRFNQTKWEELKPLKNARCHMFCFAHKKKLFAIGGCTNKEAPVNVCEVLDTEAIDKGWKVVDNLPLKTAGNMITSIYTNEIGQ